MPPDEFDQLTPSDWVVLFKNWKLKQLREDLRVARICQAVAASVGVKTSVREFLPNPPPLPKIKRKKKFKQTNPRVIERQFTSLFGGAIKPKWVATP